jgi:hypothetical protein
LQAEAKKINGDRDILFLILTSHGSQEGLAVNAGRSAETLKPSNLAVMLKRTGIRYKVVIISACYSGVFISPIADADTLVITAADANHSSFGCEDKAKWTYFGDAFFNTALRQTSNLKEAFLLALARFQTRTAPGVGAIAPANGGRRKRGAFARGPSVMLARSCLDDQRPLKL